MSRQGARLRRAALAAVRDEARHSLGRLPRRRQFAIRLHRVWRRSRLPGPPKMLTRYSVDYATDVYNAAAIDAERDLPRRYRRALRGAEMAPSLKSPADRR